jgi:uncharacterized protein YbjT (DUF2867 family)
MIAGGLIAVPHYHTILPHHTMTKPRILITGATGNIGLAALRSLHTNFGDDVEIIAGVISLEKARKTIGLNTIEYRAFDMTKAEMLAPAMQGIQRMLLVRPPQISDVPRYIAPIIEAARNAGVEHIVFLSLNGVESNQRTPHYAIEQLLRTSGIPWTFLRPSFFMQNLSTTHAKEIASRSEIFVPAGNGKTNFIDVADIGEVAARVLANPPQHVNAAYDLTGPRSYTYTEIALMLSRELGRTITYTNPSALQFFWRTWRGGTSVVFTLIMIYLYNKTKTGEADVFSPELVRLLGHEARTFEQFAHENRAVWL